MVRNCFVTTISFILTHVYIKFSRFINPKPIGLRGNHHIACSGKPHPSKRQARVTYMQVPSLETCTAFALYFVVIHNVMYIILLIEYQLCVWSGRRPSFTVSRNKRGPDDWENPSLPPHCGPSPNSVSALMRCSDSSNSVM